MDHQRQVDLKHIAEWGARGARIFERQDGLFRHLDRVACGATAACPDLRGFSVESADSLVNRLKKGAAVRYFDNPDKVVEENIVPQRRFFMAASYRNVYQYLLDTNACDSDDDSDDVGFNLDGSVLLRHHEERAADDMDIGSVYEIIREGAPCRVYFDIECEYPKLDDPAHGAPPVPPPEAEAAFARFCQARGIEYRKYFQKTTCPVGCGVPFDPAQLIPTLIARLDTALQEEYGVGVREEDAVVLVSDYKHKYSAHVIVHLADAVFKSNQHLGRFLTKFTHKLVDVVEGARCEDGSIGGEGEHLHTCLFQHIVDDAVSEARSLVNKYPQIFEDGDVSDTVLPQDVLDRAARGGLNFSRCLMPVVDLAVYTRNRTFRVMGASKLGKKSHLHLSPTCKFPYHTDYQLFLDSLVANVEVTRDTRQLEFGVDAVKTTKAGLRAVGTGLGTDGRSAGGSGVAMTGASPIPALDAHVAGLLRRPPYSTGVITKYVMYDTSVIYAVGGTRYCQGVGRPHKSNGIYFVALLGSGTLRPKCYDPDCRGANVSDIRLPDAVALAMSQHLAGQGGVQPVQYEAPPPPAPKKPKAFDPSTMHVPLETLLAAQKAQEAAAAAAAASMPQCATPDPTPAALLPEPQPSGPSAVQPGEAAAPPQPTVPIQGAGGGAVPSGGPAHTVKAERRRPKPFDPSTMHVPLETLLAAQRAQEAAAVPCSGTPDCSPAPLPAQPSVAPVSNRPVHPVTPTTLQAPLPQPRGPAPPPVVRPDVQREAVSAAAPPSNARQIRKPTPFDPSTMHVPLETLLAAQKAQEAAAAAAAAASTPQRATPDPTPAALLPQPQRSGPSAMPSAIQPVEVRDAAARPPQPQPTVQKAKERVRPKPFDPSTMYVPLETLLAAQRAQEAAAAASLAQGALQASVPPPLPADSSLGCERRRPKPFTPAASNPVEPDPSPAAPHAPTAPPADVCAERKRQVATPAKDTAEPVRKARKDYTRMGAQQEGVSHTIPNDVELLKRRKRVTVVGGGAVGVSCGYYMQRAGHDVTIVEPGTIGVKGSTWGNAGVIAEFERMTMNNPSLPRQLWGMMSWNDGPLSLALTRHFFTHTTSFGLRFLTACLPGQAERSSHGLAEINKRAGAAWKEILADLPEEHSDVLTSCPVMHACDEDHWGGLSSATKVRRARGSTLTVCENRQELAAHEPAFADEKNFPTVRAGVMYSSMYIRNPSRLVGLVCTELFQKKYGGTLVRGSVVDVRGTDVVVETGDSQKEVIRSDVVVLACGAQGLNLLPKIGEDIAPLDTERGYSIAFTGEAARSLRTSIGWTPLKFFFTPMEHGLRVAGISELGGLGPATPEHYDWLERKARMLLPSLPPRDKKHDWIGYRPSLPDMLPVISWSDRNPDVFHCYGHGHFGLTQAAVTGKLAETMVSGSEPHFDPTPYRIDRFRLW